VQASRPLTLQFRGPAFLRPTNLKNRQKPVLDKQFFLWRGDVADFLTQVYKNTTVSMINVEMNIKQMSIISYIIML